jgi:hypothetical protein
MRRVFYSRRITLKPRLTPAVPSPPAPANTGSTHRSVAIKRLGCSPPETLMGQRARSFQGLSAPPATAGPPESQHYPAARGAPECGSASSAAKALIAPAGCPRLEGPAAPWATRGHRRSSRSRTPGPPPLFALMNRMPARSSAPCDAFRMARRGSVAPRSNCLTVTSPTSDDRGGGTMISVDDHPPAHVALCGRVLVVVLRWKLTANRCGLRAMRQNDAALCNTIRRTRNSRSAAPPRKAKERLGRCWCRCPRATGVPPLPPAAEGGPKFLEHVYGRVHKLVDQLFVETTGGNAEDICCELLPSAPAHPAPPRQSKWERSTSTSRENHCLAWGASVSKRTSAGVI